MISLSDMHDVDDIGHFAHKKPLFSGGDVHMVRDFQQHIAVSWGSGQFS